uniref:Uncharacterized protein n=1 Tax=Craspedostauros australis TaxID=1486917 RepID=A0A7R9WQN9_9STRA|mmetsp:Transcript_14354/g.39524  ORF Transcript_14354/g.39524 Transcript_14354/m.39524 type:complete len:289 (+) Transcript_14354:102-968(+)
MGWYHSADFTGFDDMEADASKQEATRGGTSCSGSGAAANTTTASTAPTATCSSSSNTAAASVGDAATGYSACPLPSDSAPPPPPPDVDHIYHLCQGKNWLKAAKRKQPYFPPTFVKDGKFTRATVFKNDIISTANIFYQHTTDPDLEWICLELNVATLYGMGIPILSQEAPESTQGKPVTCLQVFGGISTTIPGLVNKIYTMKRNPIDGEFLEILEPSCGCSSSSPAATAQAAVSQSSTRKSRKSSSPPPEMPKADSYKKKSSSSKGKEKEKSKPKKKFWQFGSSSKA